MPSETFLRYPSTINRLARPPCAIKPNCCIISDPVVFRQTRAEYERVPYRYLRGSGGGLP